MGNYLGNEIPLCHSMATWPCHIDHFERQYNEAFLKGSLFRVDLIERVHKRVQFFLQSCNTADIEGVELGAFAELRFSAKYYREGGKADNYPGLGRNSVA